MSEDAQMIIEENEKRRRKKKRAELRGMQREKKIISPPSNDVI